MSGVFLGFDSFSKLILFGNKIKFVVKRVFFGLEGLEYLNFGGNVIRFVQFDVFVKMKNFKEFYISSDSFLCDCQLKWLFLWLMGRMLQVFVIVMCVYLELLKGQSIFFVLLESFVCDDFLKLQIIIQLEIIMVMVGKDIWFMCLVVSSSSFFMIFVWKKDNEVLINVDMENFVYVYVQDGEVMEYIIILYFCQVIFGYEGCY